MIRRVIVIALLCGIAAGLALAAVLPRTEPSAAAPGEPRPAPAGDPARPGTAPALPQKTDLGWVRLRATSRPRVERRLADPLGGPDWAVRTFTAERLVKDPGEPPHVIGRPLCAQLGRIHGGRFGWVDAKNTFRPVGIGHRGAPIQCGSVLPDLQRQPYAQAFSRITDPEAPAARSLQTVAWGITGSAGRPSVRIRGRDISVPPTPHGVFLITAGADVQAGELTGRARYSSGGPVPLRFGGGRGRGTVDLRTPDPNGGLPYGVTALPDPDRGWCASSQGRVVGDRVGAVDYELGILTDAGADPNGTCADRSGFGPPGLQAAPAPTRARPLGLGYSSGAGYEEIGLDPARGRTARRTLRGLTTIHGTAHPDVGSVTVASPRDVRTLRPSRRLHAILVIYDGTFPTGNVTLTATFRDGGTHRDTLQFGDLP